MLNVRRPAKLIHICLSLLTIVTSVPSQCAQRRTMPAPRKTWAAPTASLAPQWAQVPTAVVISTVNTSWSSPATALPSSMSESISASRGSETLCPDSSGIVPEPDERLCGGFDERGRAADVGARARGRGRADLAQHLRIETTGVSGPAGRLRPRDPVHNCQPVPRQARQLLPVDDVVPAAGGEQQAHLGITAGGGAGADHRHQRDDAGAAGHEQHRAALLRLPDEIAADRAA